MRSTVPMTSDDHPLPLFDPGFVPGRRHVTRLVEVAAAGGDERARAAAARALGRTESPIARAVAETLWARAPAERAHLVDALRYRVGRGEDDALAELYRRALEDEEPRVRKAAARGLAKIGDARATDALAVAARAETDASALRALAVTLGKLGEGRAAHEALDRLEAGGGAALGRALLHAERARSRERGARARLDMALERDVTVAFACRRGLENVLAEEIEERLGRAPRFVRPERVDVVVSGRAADLFRVRTALSFGFVVTAPRASGDDVEDVARALCAADAGRLLLSMTEGAARFRLRWVAGGKRRRETLAIAREVLARSSASLVNDPRSYAWEVSVRLLRGSVRLELTPNVPDPRFIYRRAEVPAASHPTIAAALVRVAKQRADDVVWDPFVGSGLELCERTLAGPYARLIGTDADADALAAARENLEAVGAHDVDLLHADARDAPVAAPTLVVTNPPMGMRVARGDDLDALLGSVVERAATMLRTGGRMVLLSPRASTTRAAAARAGLRLTHCRRVDLGGLCVELERFDRRR